MPLTYRIYQDARMLFVRGEGSITQPEYIETLVAWLADPAYEWCVDALCDFSAADNTPSLGDLWELVSMLRDRLPPAGPKKLAIVAAKRSTFNMARVFEDLIQVAQIPFAVRVFFDTELAWQWLRPEDERRPDRS
jgi:hypothetical protein